ncbi:MAG: hypothetical protein AB1668_00045 [Nanoarchaeota archaeon]
MNAANQGYQPLDYQPGAEISYQSLLQSPGFPTACDVTQAIDRLCSPCDGESDGSLDRIRDLLPSPEEIARKITLIQIGFYPLERLTGCYGGTGT